MAIAPTTVVIADENATVRAALAVALSGLGWMVVSEVEDLESLAAAAAEHEPDLLVTASILADRPVAPSLATLSGDGAVAVISTEAGDDALRTELLAGAQGWFDLDTPLAGVVAGLAQVVDGWPALSGPAVHLVVHEWRAAYRSGALAAGVDAPGLTSRETDVLAAMGRGRGTKEIAAELGLAAKTIENHKTRVFTKLGARNTAHALSIAADRGLLER